MLNDLRHALRALRRAPGFTAVTVLTLALGIGANTAVFTLVDSVLFRPAPAFEPQRLVWVAATSRGRFRNMSYPDYLAYRDQAAAVFSGVTAYDAAALSLGGDPPERINGLVVSGNYFDVLGVRAALGRAFTPAEDGAPGAHPVVVLSHSLWGRRFGSDPGMVGRTIPLNGRPFTVVGVAPPGFAGIELDDPIEMWVPMAMVGVVRPTQADLLGDANAGWLRVMARLGPGVTITQADAAARVVAGRLQETGSWPDEERSVSLSAVAGGLDPGNRGELLPVFALMSVVPFLVLLVACANAGNVLLARALGRRRELAVRKAVGATRPRLIRGLLTESVVVAALAGVLGIGVSFWLTSLIAWIGDVPAFLVAALTPDGRVLAATIALAALTGVMFGLAPAFAATRSSLVPALKNESMTIEIGRRRHRLRDVLVVGQVAISLVLLVTAGLFLRSLGKAIRVDPGFDARNGVALSFDLALQGYPPAAREAFHARLLERVGALPDVESAALATELPLSGRMVGTEVRPEGASPEERGAPVNFTSVSSGYLRTMRTRLLHGRDFDERDDGSAPPVVIVNQTLASRLWPDQDPVGRRLRLASGDEPLRTVVGVARDGVYDDLTERPRAFLYLPERQSAGWSSAISLVVRARRDPAGVIPEVTRVVRDLEPNLPLYKVQTFEQMIARVADKQRAAAALLGVLGALALLLTLLGMYGVAARGVVLRTREIGVRMSLGARAAQVSSLFVREGLALASVGVGIGLVSSWALSRVMARFLFGLSATDALTFATGAGVLFAAAALAAYLPARRAARIDPMEALRYE